ncbi:MAG: 1,4-dihydroxy-6-naphthoate synthase [Desulfovibrionaceae bacterium]
MPQQLRMGISPCPNDTFIFGGLYLGLVPCPAGELFFRLGDVEELNGWAAAGGPDVCKVSVAAAAELLDEYVLLRAGGAMGRGVGPILAVERDAGLKDVSGKVAVPGLRTTATLLFSLLADEHGLDVELVEMVYSEVMDAVQSGVVKAGVVIHEGRFVLSQHGLAPLVDLGEWWERHSGLPLPLGCIVARRSLGAEKLAALDAAIQASLDLAHADRNLIWPFVLRHAQELDQEVIKAHIRTFVTEYSREVGLEGEKALAALLHKAAQHSGMRLPDLPLVRPASI